MSLRGEQHAHSISRAAAQAHPHHPRVPAQMCAEVAVGIADTVDPPAVGSWVHHGLSLHTPSLPQPTVLSPGSRCLRPHRPQCW